MATPRRRPTSGQTARREGLSLAEALARLRWPRSTTAGGASCSAKSSSNRRYCTEDQIVECLAAEYGVPYAKLEARMFDPKIVDVLPREYIEKNLVLPLFVVRDVLTLAVSEPSNLFLIDEIRKPLPTGRSRSSSATAKDIRRMITTLPNSKVFVIDDIIEDSEAADVTLIEDSIEDIGDMEEIAGQSPVIRLVNYIIFNAVKEGASDIHIEPADRCMRVRYRIDGRLYKVLEVPLHLLNAVTSRIKIMAGLDISERRLPQDGRIHVMLEGRKIDLRVSTFPTNHGEKTVIRMLDTRSVSLNLEDLGFAEDILAALPTEHPGAQRHRAGHRADRQRQDRPPSTPR